MTHHDVFLYPGVARLASFELIISGSSPSSASGLFGKFDISFDCRGCLQNICYDQAARLAEDEKSDLSYKCSPRHAPLLQ